MKVGILSLYHYKNFGGLLQSYALYKTIERLGHFPIVIDYRVSGKRLKEKKLSSLLSPGIYIRKLRSIIAKPKNKRLVSKKLLDNFQNFKKQYMVLTEKISDSDIGKTAEDLDSIIVGSDQIWNGLDKKRLIYFFDWEQEFKGRKISYAACSIVTDFAKFNSNKIRQCLHKFDHLSVRDNYTEKFVKDYSDLSPEIVLDPTYIYDFHEFTKKRIVKEPYIFVYLLGPKIKGRRERLIEDIRKKYPNRKIFAAVIEDVSLEAENIADTVICDASPENWVNYIYYSDFVLTDSFHGTVFAMKYRKQFISYYRDFARASRLLDIADKYDLRNRIVSSIDDYISKKSLEKDIDYISLEKKINKDIEKSLEFLKKSLS